MLTDTKIRNAKTKETRYRISDRDGLYIEVSPSGKKYWRFRSNNDGKRSWRDLGEYPFVSLQDARELINKARHPVEGEKCSRDEKTPFSMVAVEWAESHAQKLTNDKEKQNIAGRLKNHILPFIGDAKITELTTADILPT